MNAVTSMKSRACHTSTKFSNRCHSLGQVKSSCAASCRLFAAVSDDERERDEEDDERDEDRARSADDVAVAGASQVDLLPVQEPADSGRMIAGDDDEQHDVARGRQAVEARLVLLVDDRGEHVGA